MNEYIVTEAMNYLDDSLLNDAMEYKQDSPVRVYRSGKTWRAAVVAFLILSLMGIVSKPLWQKESGKTIKTGNEYHVVAYMVPKSYETATLYMATIASDNSIDNMIAEVDCEADVSKAILVFHLQGDENADRMYYYPVIKNDKISRICFGTKVTDGSILTGYCGNQVEERTNFPNNVLMSLSSLTSPETPLYLVADGDTMYYIIGNNAYCVDRSISKDIILPQINTEGLKIRIIAVPLK